MTDTLEILEKVNSFYANSFSTLMNLVICVLGIIGVLLPVLITIFQSKQIKVQKDDLISIIDTHMKNGIDNARNELENIYSTKISEMELKFNKIFEDINREHGRELDNVRSLSNGACCHIQGNLYLQQKLFSDAGESFITAAENYIDAMDELNLNRVLEALIVSVIPYLGNKNEALKLSNDSVLFMENIKKLNISGRYTDLIDRFNEAISLKI